MKATARRDKMMQTDQNRLLIYTLCKQKDYTYKEMEEKTGFSFFQTKLYMNELTDKRHLNKVKLYNRQTKTFYLKFSASNLEFKPKTIEQVEKIVNDLSRSSNDRLGKGMYDDLIANNPNLRKVKLFDEKDHAYFMHGQKDKINRGIGSSWSLYESASGFDS